MTPQELQTLRQMNALYNDVEAVYHEAALRLGLSDSSCKILYAICENGGTLPLHALLLTTGLAKQTINSALRKLETEGLIRLSALDGKAKQACFTEQGKQLAAETVHKLMELENQIYQSWTSQELKTYQNLSARFLRDIKNKISTLHPEAKP